MYKINKWALIVCFCFVYNSISAQNDKTIAGFYNLVDRVIPGYKNQFLAEKIPADNGTDVFEIGTKNNKIVLKGNNSISLASALNWYLKYTCGYHISDCGSQTYLPKILPLPKQAVRKPINGKYRFHFNYCTFNYTSSWWDWKQWEKEIDLLAMNGVNIALAVVGQEAVWYNALLKMGYADEEARKFLVGPAYSAWQWMGNIQSYGGPLPKSWIDTHVRLGQQIINRYNELGIAPVLQGYSGYVPREFHEKFPTANITVKPEWFGFTGTAQLDPLDPLFKKFGRLLLAEQKKLFGANHYYATDPFHESEPVIKTDDYLNEVGRQVFDLMNEFDTSSIWVMMAWSIRKEIVTAVPQKEKLLILDLNGETWQQKENFWGYPFITGNLHNFGGRINMHGDLRLLASNQYLKAKQDAPNVCGAGMFMESMKQNPVYYDLAYELPFHQDSVEINDWLKKYTSRRYGRVSENAYAAWLILLDNPYKPGTNGVEKSSIIAARPALDVKKSGPNDGFEILYDNHQLARAIKLLLKDSALLRKSEGYQFDLTDITRQYISNTGQLIHKKVASAFKEKNIEDFKRYSQQFLHMLEDVDRLLSGCKSYSFNDWVTAAQHWANSKEEKNLYDFNASMLITQWGYDTGIEPKIYDYAWKEWSGLISGYYKPRWKFFYDFLNDCLQKNIGYKEENLPQQFGRESIDANDMYKKMNEAELQWIHGIKNPVPVVNVDVVDRVKKMLRKYSDLNKEANNNLFH